MSLPSRERGLKSLLLILHGIKKNVAPLAGAWIEIIIVFKCCRKLLVAPLAGAWIEIVLQILLSFPVNVAPLAGAWIEIYRQA